MATFLYHFRRKYHNYQLSIINCQFVRQHAKWQFIGQFTKGRVKVKVVVSSRLVTEMFSP